MIAFVGLAACGLHRGRGRLAARRAGGALRASRAQLELVHSGLRAAREGRPHGPRASRGCSTPPGACSRRRGRRPRHPGQPPRGHRAGSRHAGARPEPGVGRPGGARGPDRSAEPLPPEGARLALVAGGRQVGWLDVWGDGRPASAQARRTLSGVARLLAVILARAARRRGRGTPAVTTAGFPKRRPGSSLAPTPRMSDERPDPDALLRRVAAEEARASRGRLKIFFGAAPGVGKTYAMLEAARAKQAEGVGRRRRLGRDPRPRGDRGASPRASSGCRRGRSSTAARARGVRPRRRARPPAGAPPRRRAGPHQRAGLAPRQALAGRRGAPRRGHRRLHHAQRPAPREPQRRRRPDHRAWPSGRRCRTAPRRGGRGRVRRPARRGRSWSAWPRARSTCPSRRRGGQAASSAGATSSPCASWRCGAPPSASTPRCATTARDHAIEETWPVAERILVCVRPEPGERPPGAGGAAHGGAAARGVDRRLRREPGAAPALGGRARAPRRAPSSSPSSSGAETAVALRATSVERGAPRLRARAQRQQDRGRQAGPRAAGATGCAARSSTSSSAAAARSTSTSSRASGSGEPRRRAPGRGAPRREARRSTSGRRRSSLACTLVCCGHVRPLRQLAT